MITVTVQNTRIKQYSIKYKIYKWKYKSVYGVNTEPVPNKNKIGDYQSIGQ